MARLAALLLLHLPLAGTTTYHVGCGAGDADNNAGTDSAAGWRTLAQVNAAKLVGGDEVLFRRGCVWRGGYLDGQGGLPGAPVTYGAFGDAALPHPLLLGSVSPAAGDWSPVAAAPGSWAANVSELYQRAGGFGGITDVGNVILGQRSSSGGGTAIGGAGAAAGAGAGAAGELCAAVKKWARSELAAQDEFYFDFSTGGPASSSDLVYFHSPAGNPSTVYIIIELAIMTTAHAVIRNSAVAHVVYQDLEIKYAGADGLYGEAVRDFTVRRCQFSWIGGGCLEAGPRWKDPRECTRFGNGIEFPDFTEEPYTGPEHMTEGVQIYDNRLSQVYDAALSPQGGGSYTQRNISLHHNLITQSEYCLEIWSQGFANESTLTDVYFGNNVCVNSGGGWSHAVRPDPSGRHICSFASSGNVSRVVIRNNIFFQAVPYQAGHWMSDAWGHRPCAKGTCGWEGAIVVDHNLWFQTDASLGPLLIAGQQEFNYSVAGLKAFAALTKLGEDSLLADPLLVGLAQSNWSSAAVGLTTDLRPRPADTPGAGSPVFSAGLWENITYDFDGTAIPKGRVDIGAYQQRPAVSDACTWTSNTDVFGNIDDKSIAQRANVTRRECCATCQRTPNCSFAVFGNPQEHPPSACWLKHGEAAKQKRMFVVGATVCCPKGMSCPSAPVPPMKADDGVMTALPFSDSFHRPAGTLNNGWSEGWAATGNYSKLGIFDSAVVVVGPTIIRKGKYPPPGTTTPGTEPSGCAELSAGEIFPGIGSAWRETGAPSVTVSITWSGLWRFPHHIEAAPLLHITPHTQSFGIGIWPSILYTKPVMFIGTIGNPGHFFDPMDAAVFNHTEGQPRKISVQSNGAALRFFLDGVPIKLAKAGDDPLPIPPELRGSTLHGLAVDTHCVSPFQAATRLPAITEVSINTDEVLPTATAEAAEAGDIRRYACLISTTVPYVNVVCEFA